MVATRSRAGADQSTGQKATAVSIETPNERKRKEPTAGESNGPKKGAPSADKHDDPKLTTASVDKFNVQEKKETCADEPKSQKGTAPSANKPIGPKPTAPSVEESTGQKEKAPSGVETEVSVIIEVSAGKRITLSVKPSDTIEYIMGRIQEKTRITNEKLRLFHLGTKLENDRTISDYNIKQDTVLFMREVMTIYVIDMAINEIALDVIPSDTVKSVLDRVQKPRGAGQYEFVFDGRRLTEDSTLFDNDVEHGHVLEMCSKRIKPAI